MMVGKFVPTIKAQGRTPEELEGGDKHLRIQREQRSSSTEIHCTMFKDYGVHGTQMIRSST